MKITFYSNFLTHHQLPFCLEMKKRYGDDFKFVATLKIPEERLKLGYKDIDNQYDFVLTAYENKEKYQEALELANTSDIVIMGTTDSDIYIQERLKQDKLIFRYRERIFKNGMLRTFLDKNKRKDIYIKHIKYRKNKNLYMLCASAYGANDFNKLKLYKDKIFKWGYFPENIKYNSDELINQKEENNPIEILWAGRFIKWKKPGYVIKIAKRLKKEKIEVKIKMLGTGILFDEIKEEIEKNNLNDYIELVGAVDSGKVKDYMKKANIFLFTSGRQEGWGVVLNEALNAGCAVVANNKIGSVPFLIKDGKNGMMASDFEEFYKKLKILINNKELRKEISKNAYRTIDEEWNYINAINNLEKLFDSVINNKKLEILDGPASKAETYK